MTHDAVYSLIDAREEVALRNLQNNEDYQTLCKQQAQSEEVIEALFQRFEQTEYKTIRRHYEGELQKMDFEIKHAYVQGLRDCFILFRFLSGNEVHL